VFIVIFYLYVYRLCKGRYMFRFMQAVEHTQFLVSRYMFGNLLSLSSQYETWFCLYRQST